MKKEKIILAVGNNKTLVYETSGYNQEQEFIEQCKTVAATKPGSIQEFFIRLAGLQKINASNSA